MNQWSGINSVCYYLGYILQTYLGFTQVNSLILAGAGEFHHLRGEGLGGARCRR